MRHVQKNNMLLIPINITKIEATKVITQDG